MTAVPRYRFGDFILSPRRRMLVRHGREVPLIPRYFDLLVFLVERRAEAVHRRDIFDVVWNDVVVSDSALSQAIRAIRRALEDNSREPRFIRTVSRHGYRFVCEDIVEEEDNAEWPAAAALAEVKRTPAEVSEPRFEPLLERVTRSSADADDLEDQREAAEQLHALGTTEALQRLGSRPGHAHARALLRDTRWDVAQAGPVPILGQPGAWAAAGRLIAIRLRRAAAAATTRSVGASLGGGLAGAVGGSLGGSILLLVPDSAAQLPVVAVLAVVGGVCGATGGAGVGAGLSVAESVFRSRRALALVAAATLGGALAGASAQLLGRWSLAALVGVDIALGGLLEGVVLGAAAGAGYSLGTAQAEGGLAAPRGRSRLAAAARTAVLCGVAALLLTLAGRPLVGGTLHRISQTSPSAQATLTPVARLLGEPDFGPVTAAIVGTGEGLLFGFGLAVGLTRRPRNR